MHSKISKSLATKRIFDPLFFCFEHLILIGMEYVFVSFFFLFSKWCSCINFAKVWNCDNHFMAAFSLFFTFIFIFFLIQFIKQLMNACSEILNSKKFPKVLEYLLAIFNIMNTSGSANNSSAIQGFHLKFLSQVRNTFTCFLGYFWANIFILTDCLNPHHTETIAFQSNHQS